MSQAPTLPTKTAPVQGLTGSGSARARTRARRVDTPVEAANLQADLFERPMGKDIDDTHDRAHKEEEAQSKDGADIAEASVEFSGGVAVDSATFSEVNVGAAIQYAQAGGTAPTAPAPAGAFNPMIFLGLGAAALIVAGRTKDDPLPTLSGKVIDGYLSGAEVFVDVDNDGELDANEPRTTTDADGDFVLNTNLSGPIVARGGVDISTGLPFAGVLKAPVGSTVVTPLTTLVSELVSVEGLTVAAASTKVLQAIGQGGLTLELTRFDPIVEAGRGTSGALQIQKAGVAVATLVNEISEALASGAASATDLRKTARGVFSVIAEALNDDALSLESQGLASSTTALIDKIGARSSLFGVTVDLDNLADAKVGLSERIGQFATNLANAERLDQLGDLQKDALTRPAFTLQLLHFADAEAALLASQTAPYLAALVDKFEDQYANSITLAGGDNFIPGPFMAAGTDPSLLGVLGVPGNRGNVEIGAVDIAIHNKIGVAASAIGNHEFDLGSSALAGAFRPSSGSPGADFVYLSANLDLSGDNALKPHFVDTTATSGLETTSSLKGKVAPSAVIEVGGSKVGLVGATTQLLESISSPSGTKVKDNDSVRSDDMALLATQLQPVIDDLTAQGVNKIILLAHLQNIANEKALASLLSGVDVILAAGSNTRLGDANDEAVAFPGHAANFADTYPLVTTAKDGGTTLIVNTDNEFTYLGRLVVDFDDQGRIVTESIAANASINGAYAATAANVADAWDVAESALQSTAFASGTRGAEVKALTDAVQRVIDQKDGSVFGYSDVYLEGERINVRNQETNLGSLSADANGYAGVQALGASADDAFVVSLKNGGGIRAQIGTISAPKADGTVDKLPPSDGSVSQLDVENSLRFDNKLMAFDTTPEGLKAILEHGVASLGSQGRFPQVGGVRFAYDPDLPAGARITDIALIDGDVSVGLYDNGLKLASAPSKITVVTLNFLANGGDSYPMKANGENFRYLMSDSSGAVSFSGSVPEDLNYTATDVINNYVTSGFTLLGEQKAFETYMETFHGTPETAYDLADVPAELDTRIQNLNVRSEAVMEDSLFAYASTLKLTGAEISAFDPESGRLFVTSSAGLQVIEVKDDLSMALIGVVTLGSNDINSVAVKNGIVAVAVAAADKTQPGSVFLLNAGADLSVTGGVIAATAPLVRAQLSVGALPDMVTFTPDGSMVLVANEGEQDTAGNNPEGSVSVIDLTPMLTGNQAPLVSTASFTAFNSQLAALKAEGVRLFAGEAGFENITVARDLEPEYIAISPDGSTAMVTLQENNAIGVLDIASATFTDIVPLGLKDFSALKLDTNDRDGVPVLKTGLPVFGLYMPDSITSFTGADGKTYYAIANEGDDRDDFITPDETIRVGSSEYVLDPTVFPNAAELKTDAMLGRLTVSNAPGNRGDLDGDGDIDKIIAYGGRSFSILDDQGQMVFDSGSQLEEYVSLGGLFKSSSPSTSGLFDDGRSDNKGPEPEGITVGLVDGRMMAFVGLERGGGGVMVYDVSVPTEARLVQYLRNPADVSPEGLSFVPGQVSPSGRDLLFVTNEVSTTVTIFESHLKSRLQPGDLMFVGANADSPDAFAFVLLTDVAAGATIGFTDRDYSATTGFPTSGESALIWTADTRYDAGTVVTIQTEVSSNIAGADKGSVLGRGGGLSTTAETIYAFNGEIAGLGVGSANAITIDDLLASLNLGTAAGEIPASIAGTSLSFPEDNARYNGSFDVDSASELAALISNPQNWVTNDANAYALTGGSLFPV